MCSDLFLGLKVNSLGDLKQSCPVEFSAVMAMSTFALSNMVATGHMWLFIFTPNKKKKFGEPVALTLFQVLKTHHGFSTYHLGQRK